jgi:hypothetical protein
MWDQDAPDHFPSGFHDEGREFGKQYLLQFQGKSRGTYCREHFPDDKAAIEHCRLALAAPYLQMWEEVTVSHAGGVKERLIGTWTRRAESLVWRPNVASSAGA